MLIHLLQGENGQSQSVELSESQRKRHLIAKRAALEFKDGMAVNLGIGIPTLASNFIPEGVSIDLQVRSHRLLGLWRSRKHFTE